MKTKRMLSLILVTAVLFTLLLVGLLPALSNSTIIVDGTGDVVANDGSCILREAIINANQNSQAGSTDCLAGSGADTIQFSLPAGSVISVTNQTGTDEIVISDTLSLIGPGVDQLAISQDNTHTRRLFHVLAGTAVTITDITLRDIHALSTGQHGAVIRNNGGNVTIQRVHFRNNQTNNAGGAIQSLNNGFLTIENSEFHHNNVFSSNGGALNLDTDAVIRNSLFYSNTSSNNGGAIRINTGITVTIENSVFRENMTGNDGGAIQNHGANTTISGTTFQDNVCDTCEGGAIANFGFLTLINSTLSGNSARTGGAIYDNSGSFDDYATTIIHSTIVNNSSDPDGGGGLYIREGGSSALLNFQMHASIVANNSGGNDCDYLDWSGTISSNGYNMVESGCEELFDDATDVQGVDPNLGPLQNNGGLSAPEVPPFTHALLAGSQAINLGGCAGGSVTRDQRQAARPVGASCDAGAYEYEGIPPAPTPTPMPMPTPSPTPNSDEFVYLPVVIR